MFEECKAAEQQGFLITLNENIPERTSGAAMYYMKKHLPAAEGKIGPREIRVVRTRKNFSGKIQHIDPLSLQYIKYSQNPSNSI